MKNLPLIILALSSLMACKTTSIIEDGDEFVINDLNGIDTVGNSLPEGIIEGLEIEPDFIYDDFEIPNVRPIYNSSRTLFADLVHTKLEVGFNWAQSRMNGRATISAKQHFYSSDSLVLDAKGMDILKVELNGVPLIYTYRDSLKLSINLGKTYKKDEVFTVTIEYVAKPDERKTSGSAAITLSLIHI